MFLEKGKISIISFCLAYFWASLLTANTIDAPFKAWIELEHKSERARIVGKFRNDSNKDLNLSYKMTVVHQAKSGRSTNNQADQFNATPGITIALSEINVKLNSKDYYRILLEVYSGKNRIATDSLVNGKLNKPQAKKINKVNEILELDGLIIDETRSKLGGDFYDLFYRNWSVPEGVKDFTIRVKELPARGRVARISIEVNNEEMTQRVLQPRAEIIESQAFRAIRIIQHKLKTRSEVNKELESQDQRGSGLF